MRADRLVATLLLLQRRGQVTAADVAAELEVSVATARRDLAALSTAGVPVYPQPGRGGGWRLVGGARTDLSGLTRDEVRALFLLAGQAATTTPAVRSALRKLTGAVPATFRDDAELAGGAAHADVAAWGATSPPADVHPLVLQAAVEGRRLRFRYRDRTGDEGVREVEPWGVVTKAGRGYLVAGTPAGRRTFRLDRLSSPEVLDAAAQRPAGFSLADAWQEISTAIEGVRGAVSATVLATPRVADALLSRFGRQAGRLGVAPDGRVRVRVAAQAAGPLAEQLAGWAEHVEVEGPAEVLTHLGAIGARLVERYGRGG